MSSEDAGPETTGVHGPAALGEYAAAALVFGSSAAVLVVELVALRLLAPYLGLTLETSTTVIGLALTAIALGSWWGGRSADVIDPRRALGPLLGVSGVVVAATPLAVRAAGDTGDGTALLGVAALTILVPGALLAAVTPMVTKLRLTSLAETGTVVGRLSGLATAGSIVGTVVTGFVLVSRVPVSTILVGLGALLVLATVAVEVRVRGWTAASVPAVLVVLGGLGVAVAPGGCDAETTYHCASVDTDPLRASGRVLVLDGVRHSYVDLEDPTYLEFRYVQAIASVADSQFPAAEPLRAYHLGGGGLTLPRYLAAVRPGTRSDVSEIDPGIVRIDTERLGLRTGPDLRVRVEDGRLGLRDLADDSRDLVVGDAFGGPSVPWHLTTEEAMSDVERVLVADGVYAANIIDHGPMAFARAEGATLAAVFDHVAVVGTPETLDTPAGGNLVLVASDAPIDVPALESALATRGTGWEVRADDALTRWVDGADVLTDDHAPVDQLLTPFRATS